MLEPEIMRAISAGEGHALVPHLCDYFEIPERDGGPHVHMCMAMDVFGVDLAAFRRTSPTKALPSYTVRIILRQVAEALAYIHKLGFVHTGEPSAINARRRFKTFQISNQTTFFSTHG